MVTLKSAVFSCSAAQSSLRGRGAAHARALPSFAHTLHCRLGGTALQLAIDNFNDDVAAYLRSIGARQ
jgi:hypothetical protein